VTSLNLTVNVTQAALYPILFGGDVVTWEVSPALPAPLLFVTSSGAITGTPTSEFEPTNFTVWANNSQHSSSFVIEMWALLLDTDGDGDPDETDPDDDNDGWSDESELTCLTSTVGPLSFPTDYDGDGVCDNIDDVDDSPLFLVYSVTSQLLFLDEPMTPLAGTVFGGDVRTWEVWPLLPPGLSLNGETARTTYADGTISGAPMIEFEMQSFTIWANNSQFSSSVELTLRAVMPESDDSDFDMIYLEESLNLTAEIDEVYLEPQIFGGNVSSWLITPDLPEGLDFNLTNGVLSGVISMELNSTQYSISASNSMFLHTFTITIAAILLDTDGDGDPDVTDPDDDGDGWSDEDELECGTDPLDVLSSPEDQDGDSSCDLIDSFDDSPIVFFYPNDKLVLTVGVEMETLAPLVAPTSGGIMNFSVVPELPGGLSLNRSTGEVSGTPTEGFQHLLIEYSHTFTAVNGQWEFSYRVDFDIFPPIDTNPDDDGDGWSDVEEVECQTDPLNSSDYPEDIDKDLICSFLDEDDDGDNIGDLIDAFPKNPTAWEDTDNDTMPDDLTCRYLTDSTNCTFDLIEDLDDDNDGWPDLNETQCAKDPKDNLSIPLDDDGDGVCNLLEEYVPPAVEVLWICCFPLLLMLLMLLWILNPFTVDEEEIMGPEPEFTFTDNEWQGGSGEYDDPFLLREVTGVKPSSFAQSHEIIKISKITPRLICEFSDMSAEENGSRFSMRSIKSDSRGEVEFRLQFRDDGDTPITTTYNGLIRLGKSTVYFLWPVEVDVTKDTPEEEVAKRRATRIEREARKRAEKLEEEASRRVAATENESAQRAAEARAEAKRKMEEIEREAEERAAAAEEKAAEAEREAADIAERAEIEANRKMEEIEREAEERAAAAEEKAAEAELRAAELNVEAARRAEELEKEAQRKATEEEAKLEAERNAAQEEEDRLEAERKAAEEELEKIEREREAAEARARLRKRAEERRLAEEQQRREEEAREAEERAAEERAAEEEAAQKEREAEERAAEERAAEEEATQKEREAASKAAEEERESQMKAIKAKEKLRLKAIERKKKMDEEEEEGKIARDMAAARTSAMEAELEQRRANLDQLDEEQRRREVTLIRISERAKDIDFGKIGFATAEEKDGLQAIDGISSFVEEKLNALGIFTFSQLSRMTPKLEDDVNDAIELFPGRVKRDEWVKEAEALNLSSSPDPGTSEEKDEEKAMRAAELLRKAAERKEAQEASERALEEALKREKAIEMQRNKARSRAAERISEMESEIERRRGILSKLGKRERKKEELLIQAMERAAEVDFGIIGFAATDEREDLTKIKGIVPETEVMLNALGIFRYSQIANMTREIEDLVCEIIGLGPNQIRLEEWVEQANLF